MPLTVIRKTSKKNKKYVVTLIIVVIQKIIDRYLKGINIKNCTYYYYLNNFVNINEIITLNEYSVNIYLFTRSQI